MLIANIHDHTKIDLNNYVFICEIRPSDKPNISALKTINKTELMSKVRTRQEKEIGVREIFRGEPEKLHPSEINGEGNEPMNVKDNELYVEVTFNRQHQSCQSWDYSWRSNRWTCDTQQHVVDIIVLEYTSPTEYGVVSHFTSSEFYVHSSHNCKRDTSSNEEEIDDKPLAKKKRPTVQKKKQTGPSSATAPHDGNDSELIEASHTLYDIYNMRESAMHEY